MRFQSLFFTERLASYGFIVMAVDHPDDTALDALAGTIDEAVMVESLALRPLDMLRLINYADTLNSDGGDFDGLIDVAHIGVSGHSFGGYTALAVGGARLDLSAPAESCAPDAADQDIRCQLREHAAAIAHLRGLDVPPDALMPATTDPRIGAVVALAPASGVFTDAGIASIPVPTMLIAGSADTVLDIARNAGAAYDALRVPKARVTLENGGHYLFVVGCEQFSPLLVNAGLFKACSDPVWDMERAHDLIDHFAIAFLLYTLKGDSDALTALHAETEFAGVDYDADLLETP
ncbi:MAG: alpha/beta fold hydrolase [Anaerolineae bacterium]|nr:alpha/beta fold hydrolase [Anaerolineae bacterium]